MKISRRIKSFFVLIPSMLLALGVFAVHQNAQIADSVQSTPVGWEAPTVVSRGQPTAKERAYSKKIEHRSDPRNTISESIRRTDRAGSYGIVERIGTADFNTGIMRMSPDYFLQYLACSSDAVVFGSVISKAAHLTEDETDIYTEHNLAVKAVIKNNSGAPIKRGDVIQVVHPGGFISVESHLFRFGSDDVLPLLKNRDYLLFLRAVPEAKGYISTNSLGEFILEDNRFKTLFDSPVPSGIKVISNFQILLDQSAAAAGKGCDLKGKIN